MSSKCFKIPLYLAKMKTLKGYVESAQKDSKLIEQAVTSIPFGAASSSQSSYLVVNVFCISVVPIEPFRLIDGERFWLLPEKRD